jgi:hypothetical protein
MQASDIIKQDSQQHGVNPDVALSHVATLVNSKKATLMQKNDSVILVTMIGKGAAEVHLFTADSPLNLASSIRQFYSELKSNGHIHVMYGKADSPQIVQLMKRAGLPVENSNNPKYNWMVRL